MKEYIVIAHCEHDIDSVHNDLTTNTSFNIAVNQSTAGNPAKCTVTTTWNGI